MSRQEVVTQHFESVALDGSYPSFYSSAKHTSQNHDFLARLECVQRLLTGRLKKGMNVLDLGCGPAPICDFVLSQGARYVGMDVSQAMLDSVPRRDGVELKVGSCEAIPYADGSFAVVVAMGLVEYFDDPSRTLSEIARVTKPGGLALITVPNKPSVNRMIMRHSGLLTMLYQMRKPAPQSIIHREFSPAELSSSMSKLGLRRIGQEFYDFKLITYPVTRISADFAFFVNERVEGKLPGMFANGHIGLFQKE